MTQMPEDIREYNRRLIAEFRANGAPEGRPLLLLTTTGARTGQARTTPLMYVRLGDRLFVVASNNGAERDPDWFRNLVAHPEVRVEIGTEDFAALATVPEDSARDDLFAAIVAKVPFFADHQTRAGRTIPIVELTRI
jgi:deazaflavin-dependent oxidoreductase (nitroreductase family)